MRPVAIAVCLVAVLQVGGVSLGTPSLAAPTAAAVERAPFGGGIGERIDPGREYLRGAVGSIPDRIASVTGCRIANC